VFSENESSDGEVVAPPEETLSDEGGDIITSLDQNVWISESVLGTSPMATDLQQSLKSTETLSETFPPMSSIKLHVEIEDFQELKTARYVAR
jgi:hypothetical protein